MSLGLPPISVSLKSIAPYLQRAEELVEREPVVAYWCAYYAAQLGISLKAQDANSRKLLFNLLDALERLKKEIGPDDTIDVEPASAAHVENFALKVFRMADDEDRAGNATKSTAKKFLAAANFFEVLRVFPNTDVSESTESKLRYAKWKAVDIAKAFREGRRPDPGPAGSQLDPDLASFTPDQLVLEQHPPTPPIPIHREPSPPTKPSSRSPKRHSPPPAIPAADIDRANRLSILPGLDKHDHEALSPGRWSTTATPGFDLARTPGLGGEGSTPGSSDSLNKWHEHVVDPLTQATAQVSSGSSKLRTAWVSTEMEDAGSDVEPVEDTTLSRGRVQFTLDTPGGSSPPRCVPASPPFPAREVSSSPPRVESLPPGFVPTGGPPYSPAAGSATFGSPRARGPSLVAPAPPSVPHSVPPFPAPPPANIPSAPPVSSIAPLAPIDFAHVPAYPPPREVELTPNLIAKAQKHCRFAISALDYEDTQHAIRELRAALETLGASV